LAGTGNPAIPVLDRPVWPQKFFNAKRLGETCYEPMAVLKQIGNCFEGSGGESGGKTGDESGEIPF
jgi:hypothetical protein